MTMRLRPFPLLALISAACATPRVIPDRPARSDAAAQEFAAETLLTSAKGAFPGKLYVGNGLVRSDSDSGEGLLVVVADSATHASTAIVPHVRTAIRFEGLELLALKAEDYVTGRDGSPCTPGRPEWSCERVGDAQVGPFATVEWRIVGARGPAPITRVWVDSATHVIVKYAIGGKDPMTEEITSLVMGHQADALFAIPDGYMVAVGTGSAPPSQAAQQ